MALILRSLRLKRDMGTGCCALRCAAASGPIYQKIAQRCPVLARGSLPPPCLSLGISYIVPAETA